MKTYRLPDTLPAPEIDYMNGNHETWAKQEADHSAQVKAYLIAQGYTGKHTGRIYREGVADGYAQYMMADGRGSCLIHLPYVDGYRSRTVSGMTKASIIKLMDAEDEWQAALAAASKKK